MIKSFTYSGYNNGNHILVLGAIHGDEKCGTYAIQRIIQDIEQGKINITNGKITFIPICNPIAFKQDARYMEENLNRIMQKHKKVTSYESKLANILVDYIDSCDYILDLHSMPSSGKPFVFQDIDTIETEKFATSLGLEYIITGWPELYKGMNTGDTIGYSISKGKTGIVVECGNHYNSQSVKVAYKCIYKTIHHFGISDNTCNISNQGDTCVIKMDKMFIKSKPGFLHKDFSHLDEFCVGDVLATYHDGEIIYAPYDGYIVLPKKNAKIGYERFYIACK